MFSGETISEIELVARQRGIDPAALLAVAEVESGGRAFALVEGRREPLIRFEGHYFDRLVDAGKREEARAKGVSSPKMGAVKNPRGQAARWRLLEEAISLDRDAALQSVSWGIGQVMGAHWKALGYGSPQGLADEARSGVAGQVRLMIRFLEENGLIKVMKACDWAAFARAYNGPKYRQFEYDTRLAAAYERHKAGAPAVLRKGSCGEAVEELQRKLATAGHAVDCDGIFGAGTERAVRAFQAAHRLDADGIAGPATMAALSRGEEQEAVGGLWRWLAAILARLSR